MPSRNILDCAAYLQIRWPLLKARFEADHPGSQLRLLATYRSPEEQQQLYAQGRTKPGRIVTKIDGIRRMSNHNHRPSRAFDVGIFRDIDGDGKLDYVTTAEAYDLRKYARELNLEWGGDWVSFKDRPHFEIP